MSADVYGAASRVASARNVGDAVVRRDQTRVIELFMAGDVEHCKQIVRRFCMARPCCVTVTPTSYIYRGGEESGFVVGFRNYPRFPSDGHSLEEIAQDLGDALRSELGQDSHMVVDHAGQTTWSTTRQGG